jgi:hypothetical protein
MTIARSAADVLSGHVTLEVECVDRMYLNLYVPKLQYESGVVGFLREHRGATFASSALMGPMTRQFLSQSCNCRCGPARESEARWQIASTAPVQSVTPNRSRASSEIPRREIRCRAVNLTTAACNLGLNGDVRMRSGNPALDRARQSDSATDVCGARSRSR